MGTERLIPWLQPSPLGTILLLGRESGALLLCTWPDAEAMADPLAHCAEVLGGAELLPRRQLPSLGEDAVAVAAVEAAGRACRLRHQPPAALQFVHGVGRQALGVRAGGLRCCGSGPRLSAAMVD